MNIGEEIQVHEIEPDEVPYEGEEIEEDIPQEEPEQEPAETPEEEPVEVEEEEEVPA